MAAPVTSTVPSPAISSALKAPSWLDRSSETAHEFAVHPRGLFWAANAPNENFDYDASVQLRSLRPRGIKETVPTVLLTRNVRVGARRQEVQAFPMSDNAQRLSTPLRVGGFHDGVVREECAHLRVGFVTKARGRTTTANTWYLRSKLERGASPVGPTSGVQRQLHGTESALTAGE